MDSSAVTQLLESIQDNTSKYLSHIASQKLPEPTFIQGDGLNPYHPLPNDVAAAKDAALESTIELHYLLLGPLGLILRAPGEVSSFDPCQNYH